MNQSRVRSVSAARAMAAPNVGRGSSIELTIRHPVYTILWQVPLRSTSERDVCMFRKQPSETDLGGMRIAPTTLDIGTEFQEDGFQGVLLPQQIGVGVDVTLLIDSREH
jgi:hypothetical protein